MNLYEHYLSLQEQKKGLDAAILDCQVALYNAHKERLDEKETGIVNIQDGNYKLTVVKKESVTVDQALASVVGVGFKKKFTLDKKAYNALSPSERKRVDECLTTKPAKPSFAVEKIDGN